ncbi:MAG TPA: hypothetical protein PLA88_08795 [Bacteroidales bacterium]|nr:hypothetical protein [Bacteroidales bacterium]
MGNPLPFQNFNISLREHRKLNLFKSQPLEFNAKSSKVRIKCGFGKYFIIQLIWLSPKKNITLAYGRLLPEATRKTQQAGAICSDS